MPRFNFTLRPFRVLLIATLCSLLGHSLAHAQDHEFRVQEGQFIFKTNPLMFVLPEPNLALEVGISENLSLEGRLSVFRSLPRWIGPLAEPFNPSSYYPGWVSSHLVLRHYIRKVPVLFLSYGMMFKQWKYRNHPVVSYEREFQSLGQCHLEDRRALVFGPKGLMGVRFPMFEESAVFEFYYGMSMKFRFEEGFRRENPDCNLAPVNLGRFSETNVIPGFLLGFNFGIVLN